MKKHKSNNFSFFIIFFSLLSMIKLFSPLPFFYLLFSMYLPIFVQCQHLANVGPMSFNPHDWANVGPMGYIGIYIIQLQKKNVSICKYFSIVYYSFFSSLPDPISFIPVFQFFNLLLPSSPFTHFCFVPCFYFYPPCFSLHQKFICI